MSVDLHDKAKLNTGQLQRLNDSEYMSVEM